MNHACPLSHDFVRNSDSAWKDESFSTLQLLPAEKDFVNSCELTRTEHDTTFRQIVWRHFNRNLVARQYADVVFTHFA